MNQNWSESFPDQFYINGSSLHRLPCIENFDEFVALSNKYRNIFRSNFQHNDPFSYDESFSFLKNLIKDNSRVWYAISFEEEWIGQFGVKYLGKQKILLDNAVRFSSKGGQSIFKDINHLLIEHIKTYLPDHNILIIVKKSNSHVMQLHEGFSFKECKKDFYEQFFIDSSSFALKMLKK
tara:strand:- start:108 stop:644 length:537 start_codon:yes stop_codon:yes gene_type:complete